MKTQNSVKRKRTALKSNKSERKKGATQRRGARKKPDKEFDTLDPVGEEVNDTVEDDGFRNDSNYYFESEAGKESEDAEKLADEETNEDEEANNK